MNRETYTNVIIISLNLNDISLPHIFNRKENLFLIPEYFFLTFRLKSV